MSEEEDPDRLIELIGGFAEGIADLVMQVEKISPKKVRDVLGDKYEGACDWLELINTQLSVATKACKVGAVGMVLGRLKKFIERNHDDER